MRLSPRREPGCSAAPVQILVVVANTQVRRLRTEVEKASVRTAIAHGSGGPNPLGTSPSCKAGGRVPARSSRRLRRPALLGRGKGSRTNIPAPAAGKWFGDALVGLGDWLGRAPEEFSFLLDGRTPHGTALRLKMGKPPGKRPQYCAVVVPLPRPCKIPGRPLRPRRRPYPSPHQAS